MSNKDLLAAMALDLKRVALGLHSHSNKMADVFLKEVYKRLEQLDYENLSPNIKKVLGDMKRRLEDEQSKTRADDALMYSTIILSFTKTM